ncbi:MAG: hypothetical protein JNJ59_26790 [Deltaproteobacteria bacterium]|nr:hypothetical protein [Deltaproteobacteria bacterium]
MDKDQTTPVTIACGCGKKLGDSAIIEEPRYGFFGDLTLLFGVTAAPKRIDYRCVKCGKVVHSASDAQTIKQFTH